MSSLSDQQPGSSFSEFSELCAVPAALPPQSWDWQRPLDMGPPQGLVVDGGLSDEDKLCFFEQPGQNSELKVPGRAGGLPGSSSLGQASLGSAGESPDSPLSSSPSPSPASPGRLQSSLGCGGSSTVYLPPVTESPSSPVEVRPAPDAAHPPSAGGSLLKAPADEDSPSAPGKESSSKEPPHYCVGGAPYEEHLQSSEEVPPGPEDAWGGQELSEGSLMKDCVEDEEEAEELEPCLMGRAQQQRRAMRRAIHQAEGWAESDPLLSPLAGPRRSSHSMKRSLTVAEDQPPTPPPTLSTAGATHSDLRLAPPDPRSGLCPPPPLRDASVPLLEAPGEAGSGEAGSGEAGSGEAGSGEAGSGEAGSGEAGPGGVVLPVPLTPPGSSSRDSSSALTVASETQGAEAATRLEDSRCRDMEEEVRPDAGSDFGSGNGAAVRMEVCDGDLAAAGQSRQDSNSNTNRFILDDECLLYSQWRQTEARQLKTGHKCRPSESKQVKSDKMERKEEKLEENVKKVEPTDSMSEPEQRGVKVEYARTETPAKGEKVIEKDKEKENTESKRLKDENQADNTKDTEKKEEKANDQETEMGKETKRQKDEFIQPSDQKEDKMHKEEASNVNMGKPEKLAEVEMMNKGEKADSVEKMEEKEKSKVEEKAQGAEAKKSEVKEDKEQHTDGAETAPAQPLTPVKPHASGDVTEKMAEEKTEEKEEPRTEKADKEETKKTDDEASRPEPPAGKVLEKTEKEEKPDRNAAEKKADKKEKPAKADAAEKARRAAKPPGSAGSTAPSRDPPAADRKTKVGFCSSGACAASPGPPATAGPWASLVLVLVLVLVLPAAGGAKPGTTAKVRPTNMAAGVSAIAKRPAASSNPTTSDKKPSTSKAPSTIPVGPKRPSATSISRPSSSSTSTSREVKPKVTTDKRPLVPKVSTATSNPSGSSRTGTTTTAASRPAPRPAASARPPAAAALARKPLATKADSKPGEEKKPGTMDLNMATGEVSAPVGHSSTGSNREGCLDFNPSGSSLDYGAAADRLSQLWVILLSLGPPAAPPAAPPPPPAPRLLAPAPPQPERPPPPQARQQRRSPWCPASPGPPPPPPPGRPPAARPSSAPAPDIRNARSKIGSTDNMKHQPGGGKVGAAAPRPASDRGRALTGAGL
ncbi:unnamed protein product [Menidia menidia]|uniref:Microtubule-associated protein n=1 Tax=Menidia menidia TaxID=238744 RepID=A0A8S4AT62_9TELE|nr:unnamed protein product [Menidia menidia]